MKADRISFIILVQQSSSILILPDRIFLISVNLVFASLLLVQVRRLTCCRCRCQRKQHSNQELLPRYNFNITEYFSCDNCGWLWAIWKWNGFVLSKANPNYHCSTLCQFFVPKCFSAFFKKYLLKNCLFSIVSAIATNFNDLQSPTTIFQPNFLFQFIRDWMMVYENFKALFSFISLL